MNIKSTLALSALLLSVAGCVTKINVKPATPKAFGTRYSLPKPLLKVTPQPDGTAKFEWIYVPDDERTYAIATSSYFAKQKTTIEVDGSGLLKKVSWAPMSSDVAAQLISNAADVTKARLTALETAQKEAQKKADDAAKAIQSAKDELTAAEDKVASLLAERDAHIANGDEVKRKETEVKLAVARAELEAKKKKLNALLGVTPPTNTPAQTEGDPQSPGNEVEDDTAGGTPPGAPVATPTAPVAAATTATNSATPAAATPATVTTPAATTQATTTKSTAKTTATKQGDFAKSWGPLFFEIVEEEINNKPTVKLVPINTQQQFATSTKPKPEAAKPTVPVVTVKNPVVLKEATNVPLHLVISSSVPLTSVGSASGILTTKGGQVVTGQFYSFAVLSSVTDIDVVLKPDIPVGTYTFSISYETALGPGEKRIEATFEVGEVKKK